MISSTTPTQRTWHCDLSAIGRGTTAQKRRGAPMWLIAQLKEREDRLFIPQLYQTVNHFFARWAMPVPRTGHWRLTNVELGALRACPHSQGFLVATDGVQCYIETGDKLFHGHLENWERFDDGAATAPKATTSKRQSIFDELAAERKTE